LILGVSSVAVTLASLAGALVETWHLPDGRTLFMLICAGVLSMTGQLCVVIAVRSAAISVVAPFRYAGIIWALILDLAIWAHLPDFWSMMGICAVSGAGIYTFYRESVLKRKVRGPEEIVR
jgi:drug/metabolite transporter (DMT)-like permease